MMFKEILLKSLKLSSLIIFFIGGTLLATSYIQLQFSSPLENEALEELATQIDEGNSNFTEGYRELHLMARRAFFIKQSQINILKYATIGALFIFLLIFQLERIKNRDKNPKSVKDNRSTSFMALIYSGFFIAGIGLILSFTFGSFAGGRSRNNPKSEVLDGWTSFRGQNGSAIAEFNDIPEGSTIDEVWQIEIELDGYSSPVIFKDSLFLTSSDGTINRIECFNISDGEKLWTFDSESSYTPEVSKDTGFAASTITLSKDGLFAVFASGDFIALDHKGNRLWKKYLAEPDISYGYSSSPVYYNNMVIVQFDHRQESYIAAFDSKTGEEVWKTIRDDGTSWSTPLIAETEKGNFLFVNGGKHLTAYDPATGTELWKVRCLGGEVAPSSTYYEEYVFPVNANSYLSAVDINKGEIIWQDRDFLPDTSSPVAADGRLFLAMSWAYIGCFDIESGQLLWEEEFEVGFYSSPIAIGNNLIAIDREGTIHIFANSDSYKAIASLSLDEKVDATPAIYKNRIYVRGVDNLFCLEIGGN